MIQRRGRSAPPSSKSLFQKSVDDLLLGLLLGETQGHELGELLPGDLLFFSRSGRASGIFHVGIYIGDGQFVHAANSSDGLIVTDIDHAWYANRYLGAKRPNQ